MGEILALVVEDSAVHRRLLAEAFKAAGSDARPIFHADADSAWNAIEAMRSQSPSLWPDLAIVDIGLPGMSGIELVDRIRQLRHFDGWPIFMLTASRDPDDRSESLLAKATGYFTKPETAAGYAALVRDILETLEGPGPSERKVRARPKAPGAGKPDPR